MGALSLLNELPAPLLAGWAAWLATGLALLMWTRRLNVDQVAVPAVPAPMRSPAKPRSGVRRSVSVPAEPVTQSHAFEELQALLDTPPVESIDSGRRPGDA